MIARKDNKVYTISATEVSYYASQGFDIYDEQGTLQQYADTKTIKYNDHLKIVEALNQRIAELEKAAELEKNEPVTKGKK